MYKTLIDKKQLLENLDNSDWVVIDCSYDLVDLNAGRDAYLSAHIPGAIYADVHDDLSGPPVTDQGRHPLPTEAALNQLFSRLGITHSSQVVVYDNTGGAFAGRLWWMLRYMGHEAVAVLDGGMQAWQEAGLSTEQGNAEPAQTEYAGVANQSRLVLVDDVPSVELLIDSRDPARYRGDEEPLDKAAGHIPGAINRFWKQNLTETGLFKSASELRLEFEELIGATAAEEAVFYCGSGVTACHNLLAAEHAGIGTSKLYAGSWSDWCSDPERTIATGENT